MEVLEGRGGELIVGGLRIELLFIIRGGVIDS